MRKGFTLIELLIVIAIIGLLATLAIVSLTTAQQKARDTRRVADLKQIQNATELYFSEAGTSQYPDPAGSWSALGGLLDPYLSAMPIDPTNSDTYYYAFAVNDAFDEYVIGATLEQTGHAALDGDDDTDYDSSTVGWTALVTGNNFAVSYGTPASLAASSLANSNAAAAGSLDSIQCNDVAPTPTVAGAYCLSD